MKKYQLHFSPSPLTQPVFDTGGGKVARITVSHDAEGTQPVTFYDREGKQVAHYQVHPMRSPWTITYANRDSFSFTNGLQINTGNCTVDLLVIY